MKTWSRVLGLALCASVLAILSVPTSSRAVDPGPPGGLNVNVVNTPLPVTGTVTGSVSITGTPNVNVINTPKVQVTGTVETQTAIPSGAFSVTDTTFAPLLGPDPAGTSYAITSVTLANLASIAQEAGVEGIYGTTSNCITFTSLTSSRQGPLVIVPANATVHLSFPQPFVIAAQSGAVSCLVPLGSSIVKYTVVGFKF